MAAISHVFTIRRAAQILGRDEDLLWELSDQLEPEDGKLWVYDIDALKPSPSPTMASRRFAKLSRIRSIAPVNLNTSVPRCSAYAYHKGGHWYDTFFEHTAEWLIALFTGTLWYSTHRLWRAGERQFELAL